MVMELRIRLSRESCFRLVLLHALRRLQLRDQARVYMQEKIHLRPHLVYENIHNCAHRRSNTSLSTMTIQRNVDVL